MKPNSCWIGAMTNCQNTTNGWVSRAHAPSPTPSPPSCTTPFCSPSFDSSSWWTVEVPHDYSIEDLSARAADLSSPVLALRKGTWLFHTGDNSLWPRPALSDASWLSVSVPYDWRSSPTSNTSANAYQQQAFASASMLRLSLGSVSAADQIFINGVQMW